MIAGFLTIGDLYREKGLVAASKRLEVGKEEVNLVSCAYKAIIWEAIKRAKERGCKIFDMGGYYAGGDKSDPRYRINFFKEGFGGKLVVFYKYQKYYSTFYKLSKRVWFLINKII